MLLDRLRTHAVFAALFVAPLVYWPWAKESFSTVKSAALVAYLFPAFGLWWCAGRPGIKSVSRWYLALAGGFLAWALVRLPGGEDGPSALVRGGEWLLTFAAAAAVLGLAGRSRRRALDILLGSTAIAALIGIAQHFFGWQFISPYEVDQRSVTFTQERVFSTFGNPIFFAGHLILVLPLAMAELSSAPRHGRRFWFLAAAVVVQLIGLALTSSRGAFLGLAAGLGWLAYGVKELRRWIVGLALAVAVVTGLVGVWRPALVEHLLVTGDPGRLLMWRTALTMWRSAPGAGVGLGQFTQQYPCVQQAIARPDEVGLGHNAVHAHNEYLEAGAELGFPGAMLFLALVGGLLILPAPGLSGWAVKAGVLAIAVQALFNFPFHNTPTQMFVWMLPALVLFPVAPGRRETERWDVLHISRYVMALLAVLVLGGLFLRPFVRSSYVQWGLAYQDAKRYQKSGQMFTRALAILPDDAHTRLVFHHGRMLFLAGDLPGAQRKFERDQVRFPCYPEGFGNLAVIYGVRAQNGEPGALQKALNLIAQALQRRPGGKEAAGDYNSLGNLRVIAGDEEGAVESYRTALRWDTGYVEAATNACYLLVKMNRPDEAAEILLSILKENPHRTELLQFARDLKIPI